MKTGKSIVELAQEIERQQQSKKDYIAPTQRLNMEAADGGAVVLAGLNGEPLALTNYAHGQIASEFDVPKKYYDKMLAEAPGLLAENMNHWFQKEPKNRLVRTMDGRVRAFLSDKYRPLDYAGLAEAVMPVLGKLDLEIISSEITEKRLYIKAVDKRITKDIPTGKKMGDGSHTFFDTMSPAIVISNSEVGAGALAVEAGVWTRLCTNLVIVAQRSMRRYHIGGRNLLQNEDQLAMLLTDDTRKKTDVAIWAQVRDVVTGAFDRARFDALTEEIAATTENKIVGDPMKAMEVTAVQLKLTDGERGSVLRHLIEGGDLSQYGLFNAVTRTAEDQEDYDRATEFERMGGQVITLSPQDWSTIATAA